VLVIWLFVRFLFNCYKFCLKDYFSVSCFIVICTNNRSVTLWLKWWELLNVLLGISVDHPFAGRLPFGYAFIPPYPYTGAASLSLVSHHDAFCYSLVKRHSFSFCYCFEKWSAWKWKPVLTCLESAANYLERWVTWFLNAICCDASCYWHCNFSVIPMNFMAVIFVSGQAVAIKIPSSLSISFSLSSQCGPVMCVKKAVISFL